MPKYYRYKAMTPIQKLNRCPTKENKREIQKFNVGRNWLGVTLICSPAQSWYMRRTAWRKNPPPFVYDLIPSSAYLKA